MARMRFGVFIAPHHPVREHPTLQYERDLQLIEHFDQLGYDEVWVGEHHSGGCEAIVPLLRSNELVTVSKDWYDLQEGYLQIRPVQDDMEIVAAVSISPSGMRLAGKYGLGVISVASYSPEGLQALPTQWSWAETY